MKIHKYIIKHTKDKYGKDNFCIYHLWFGFIKWPFIEKEVHSGICEHKYWRVYKRHYIYSNLYEAKEELSKYLNNPHVEYKGHTLTRCSNNMWIDFSSSQYIGRHTWCEYRIGGTLEQAKKEIDNVIQEKQHLNFSITYEIK